MEIGADLVGFGRVGPAAKSTLESCTTTRFGDQDMKKTRSVLVLAIGVVTMAISVAPLAGADPNNCQNVGAATVCGQGSVNSGGQPAAPGGANQPGNSCTNAYGGYQNCKNS